ncbi:hypothetical protein HK105_202141 [Polyrhizophydium stewartii]|uniref:Uncharacterized protein n=1 Tax=Polyrhizophydium stewartii TaxID=2732419 RepID=A0ABR4NFI6_9FUNG
MDSPAGQDAAGDGGMGQEQQDAIIAAIVDWGDAVFEFFHTMPEAESMYQLEYAFHKRGLEVPDCFRSASLEQLLDLYERNKEELKAAAAAQAAGDSGGAGDAGSDEQPSHAVADVALGSPPRTPGTQHWPPATPGSNLMLDLLNRIRRSPGSPSPSPSTRRVSSVRSRGVQDWHAATSPLGSASSPTRGPPTFMSPSAASRVNAGRSLPGTPTAVPSAAADAPSIAADAAASAQSLWQSQVDPQGTSAAQPVTAAADPFSPPSLRQAAPSAEGPLQGHRSPGQSYPSARGSFDSLAPARSPRPTSTPPRPTHDVLWALSKRGPLSRSDELISLSTRKPSREFVPVGGEADPQRDFETAPAMSDLAVPETDPDPDAGPADAAVADPHDVRQELDHLLSRGRGIGRLPSAPLFMSTPEAPRFDTDQDDADGGRPIWGLGGSGASSASTLHAKEFMAQIKTPFSSAQRQQPSLQQQSLTSPQSLGPDTRRRSDFTSGNRSPLARGLNLRSESPKHFDDGSDGAYSPIPHDSAVPHLDDDVEVYESEPAIPRRSSQRSINGLMLLAGRSSRSSLGRADAGPGSFLAEADNEPGNDSFEANTSSSSIRSIRRMERDNAILHTQVQTTELRIQELELALHQAEQELKIKTRELESLTKHEASLTEKSETLMKANDDLKKEEQRCREIMTKLQKQVDSLQSCDEMLSKQLMDKEEQLEEYSATIQSLRREVAESRERANSFQDRLQEAVDALTKIEASVFENTLSNQEKASQCIALEQRIAELETQLADARDCLDVPTRNMTMSLAAEIGKRPILAIRTSTAMTQTHEAVDPLVQALEARLKELDSEVNETMNIKLDNVMSSVMQVRQDLSSRAPDDAEISRSLMEMRKYINGSRQLDDKLRKEASRLAYDTTRIREKVVDAVVTIKEHAMRVGLVSTGVQVEPDMCDAACEPDVLQLDKVFLSAEADASPAPLDEAGAFSDYDIAAQMAVFARPDSPVAPVAIRYFLISVALVLAARLFYGMTPAASPTQDGCEASGMTQVVRSLLLAMESWLVDHVEVNPTIV